ncbi:MAG: hypothetical protein ACXVWU_00870 [Nocardioides sp.]
MRDVPSGGTPGLRGYPPGRTRHTGAAPAQTGRATDAEYVGLTQLQVDAFITLDTRLAHALKDVVPVAPIEALS